MTTKQILLDLIPRQGILPLYFHRDVEVSVNVMRALCSAGIRALEYTNRGDEAFGNFLKMKEVRDLMKESIYLGIGTVKNRETAEKYINAGCDFIVCPGLSEAVAEEANKRDMLWIPGCMTPSEIMRAEFLGASLIKVFPGNVLGPEFISSLKPLFSGLMFMPTGGVEMEEKNLSQWLKAGACAVGMGSKLVSSQLMEQRDYAAIEINTKNCLGIFESAQKGKSNE